MKMQRHQDEHFEMEVTYNRSIELILLITLGLLLLAHLGLLGYRIKAHQIPFQAMTYVFSSLVFVHALYMLGWRRALAFLATTTIISFLFEHVGVKTGWIFGQYHYTDVLNPKLLGTVPVVIPLAYFMVLYPSYMIANLITRGFPTGSPKDVARLLLISMLTALVMTAWDLTMDPVMVYQAKAWVWEQGGPYIGIPLRNFSGWVLTTFVAGTVYRMIERWRHVPMRPFGRGHRTFIVLPILGYATLCIGDLFVGYPLGTRAIAPFSMGIPLLAALMRLYRPRVVETVKIGD
ncbi:MAG TPA: carotenoid biosynthesis protein [Holophaga sp.]|jgi:putative membrane protein|nr:carotenoid biosynthesis protein [Holophaga sp.]